MTTESLWDFSNRIYSHRDVEKSCLYLQDHHGADVNLLLFCFWSGVTHGRLTESQLASAIAMSVSWSEGVVQPLRSARRWLKAFDGESALRSRIKANELDAERIQQVRLQDIAAKLETAGSAGIAAAAANIEAWLVKCEIQLDERGRRALRAVLSDRSGVDQQ